MVGNVPVTAGGGQVFAAELVAKKIIVFFGGITNEEADRQAPYRYLGGFDNNATAINTATVRRPSAPGRDREVVG